MYIDFEYYRNEYKGLEIPQDEFDALALRSCDMIDILTFQKIAMVGFDNLNDFQKAQIKKACAAQVEYLYSNGGINFIADSGNIASMSIGNFSIGSKNRSNDNATGGSMLSPVVKGYLAMTGLLYRGVRTCL